MWVSYSTQFWRYLVVTHTLNSWSVHFFPANIYLLLVITSFFGAKKITMLLALGHGKDIASVLVASPCLPKVRNIDSVREIRTVWRVKTRWFFLKSWSLAKITSFPIVRRFSSWWKGGEINQIPIFEGKSSHFKNQLISAGPLLVILPFFPLVFPWCSHRFLSRDFFCPSGSNLEKAKKDKPSTLTSKASS